MDGSQVEFWVILLVFGTLTQAIREAAGMEARRVFPAIARLGPLAAGVAGEIRSVLARTNSREVAREAAAALRAIEPGDAGASPK